MQIWTRRVYEAPSSQDGHRVLVDRVWPRGVSKEEARVDDWRREVAPSKELRQWFGHDPDRWDEFKRRYFTELDANPDAVRPLRAVALERRLTLVFGARETRYNNAVALKQYLLQGGGRQ